MMPSLCSQKRGGGRHVVVVVVRFWLRLILSACSKQFGDGTGPGTNHLDKQQGTKYIKNRFWAGLGRARTFNA